VYEDDEDDEDLGPIVTIDLRAVRVRIEECEGDLVLLVDDGDIEVEFGSGIGGTFEQAIFGAERLAGTALAYAHALRDRRPTRPPKQGDRRDGEEREPRPAQPAGQR
jgi:hypothetical protein